MADQNVPAPLENGKYPVLMLVRETMVRTARRLSFHAATAEGMLDEYTEMLPAHYGLEFGNQLAELAELLNSATDALDRAAPVLNDEKNIDYADLHEAVIDPERKKGGALSRLTDFQADCLMRRLAKRFEKRGWAVTAKITGPLQ